MILVIQKGEKKTKHGQAYTACSKMYIYSFHRCPAHISGSTTCLRSKYTTQRKVSLSVSKCLH